MFFIDEQFINKKKLENIYKISIGLNGNYVVSRIELSTNIGEDP